jgi:hypothetical protein
MARQFFISFLLLIFCCGIGATGLTGCSALYGSKVPLVNPGGQKLLLAKGKAVPALELPPELNGGASGGAGSAVHETPSGSAARIDPEIADVSNIPQSMAMAVRAFPSGAMSMACQKQYLEKFQTRNFAPWLDPSPIFDPAEAASSMQSIAAETWFGENRRHVPKVMQQKLLDLCDLEHFPSQNLAAIAVRPTFLRVLPTMKPFYRNMLTSTGGLAPDELSFDRLQNTEIKINEPLRLLHVSADGAWAFVESPFANGWVDAAAVRLIDPQSVQEFIAMPKVVVVKDFPVIHDYAIDGYLEPKVGTIFPVLREMSDRYLILVAGNTGSPTAHLLPATIDRMAARPFPLTFTQENVAMVGEELLGRPYGWGDAYHDRDCSGTTRDFFLPFGIWLPRNSAEQINAGPKISFAGMTSQSKEQAILENGVPFLTLIHLDGHIMLYSGLFAQQPTIFHSPWGIAYRSASGRIEKQIIGKSVITSLEPGKELPLAGQSYLERFTGMLVLTDACFSESAQ